MIKRVARSEATIAELPGRTWYTYIGPASAATERVTLGVSVFPPGSRPAGHVHEAEEETVYVAAGHGRLVTAEATAELAPGVAVHIEPGTFHSTEADGPEPLELVCVFTPPVVAGSYERRDG